MTDKAPTLGLDCPHEVYRIPDGVRFLIVSRGGSASELCDHLHGGSVLIVVDDHSACVYVNHRAKPNGGSL